MLVKCDSCGWVHVAVSEDSALECVRSFNEMYSHLTDEQREEYYHSKPAKMMDYMECSRCGKSYQQMSPVSKEDQKLMSHIRGKTLQSVLKKCTKI